MHTHPIPRRARSGGPENVGNGNDYALVADGLISQTVGSFPSVIGVISESSVGVPAFGDGGILGPNEYTLQINTNANLGTSACSGGAATCSVWQQFIYATDYETSGSAAWRSSCGLPADYHAVTGARGRRNGPGVPRPRHCRRSRSRPCRRAAQSPARRLARLRQQ